MLAARNFFLVRVLALYMIAHFFLTATSIPLARADNACAAQRLCARAVALTAMPVVRLLPVTSEE